MRELTPTEQTIVDAIDEQLEKINRKLEPFKELLEQQQRLNKTKATLLNERVGSPGRGQGGYTQLTHEQVENAFRSHQKQNSGERYMTVSEISHATGTPDSTVRSHLNRGRTTGMYKRKDGKWRLTGQTEQTEEE